MNYHQNSVLLAVSSTSVSSQLLRLVVVVASILVVGIFDGQSQFHVTAFQSIITSSKSQKQHLLLESASTNIPCWSFSSSTTQLHRSKSKWDDLIDEDEEEEQQHIPAPPDMKYIERNVMRQHQNFVAIREAGGKELTNDVYVPEPDSGVMWFVGKVARISDISLEQAIARQWPLIVQHAANLRPLELYPSRGHLEVWTAPGDSELEVAYNRPDIVFQKMDREVEGASTIKANLVGFQGEVYDKGQGMGFRTWRTADGRPSKPEIQTPESPNLTAENEDEEFSEEKFRAPTEEELKKLQDALKEKNMDISELYEEQQKREGKSDQ